MLISDRQNGVSLVELMIGTAIGLVLMAGVLVLAVRLSAASVENIQRTRLHQQMRSTMDFMVRDLQRAGYVNWEMAMTHCPRRGPSYGEAWDMMDFYHCLLPVVDDMGRVLPESLRVGGDCILYSYDLDEDGAKNSDQFELFGFKLRNNAVVSRSSGSAHECDTGVWQPITDANLVVTSLDFRIEYLLDAAAYRLVYSADDSRWMASAPAADCTPGSGSLSEDKCIWRRMLVVTLEGHLGSDSGVNVTLVNRVKIRNDRLQSIF